MDGYVEYFRSKYRIIPEEKVFINRNTPVGEDAEFFERKPYGGKREFYPILKIKNNKVHYEFYKKYYYKSGLWVYEYPIKLLEFLEEKNILK